MKYKNERWNDSINSKPNNDRTIIANIDINTFNLRCDHKTILQILHFSSFLYQHPEAFLKKKTLTPELHCLYPLTYCNSITLWRTNATQWDAADLSTTFIIFETEMFFISRILLYMLTKTATKVSKVLMSSWWYQCSPTYWYYWNSDQYAHPYYKRKRNNNISN